MKVLHYISVYVIGHQQIVLAAVVHLLPIAQVD